MGFESPGAVTSASSQTERQLRLLIETGLLFASERSLDVLAQAAADAGLRLAGAQLGAFFYNKIGQDGDTCALFKVSASNPSFLSALATNIPEIPRNSFLCQAILRSSDITNDRRLTQLPFSGNTPGHPPVRSYLCVPVRNRTGDLLGCLIYGHSAPGVFTSTSEDLVATVASQAAVSIDNLRLSDSLNHEISHVDTARALQRETADRLRQALDAAQLGTWTWDRASDLLDLDERAAELLHAQPHAPVTRTSLRERIVATEDRRYTYESLEKFLESGGIYSAEYRVDSGEGVQTWVSARGIATFAAGSSEINGMVGTVQDITSRKSQENALRQSEKLAATGRLAATIAHEINNPLEAVTNLIYLSRTDPDVPSSVQLLLETADSELARVAQIAQQTLGFYRDTTRPVEINLNDLLQSVVELFARKMVSRKITCTLDLEPNLCINGLQGEIRQVFSNLIVNAIDAFTFAPVLKPGRIHIRGRHLHSDPQAHSPSSVSILICDEGSGIPSSVRQRIFSPFFTTKLSVGTGLGLWVTRGFIEKQGGSIRFRTRTTDPSGTIFRVVLPIGAPSSDPHAELSPQHLTA
ncbi:MAG: ATP-binding protein [Acidobacteriaceae bacterium]